MPRGSSRSSGTGGFFIKQPLASLGEENVAGNFDIDSETLKAGKVRQKFVEKGFSLDYFALSIHNLYLLKRFIDRERLMLRKYSS